MNPQLKTRRRLFYRTPRELDSRLAVRLNDDDDKESTAGRRHGERGGHRRDKSPTMKGSWDQQRSQHGFHTRINVPSKAVGGNGFSRSHDYQSISSISSFRGHRNNKHVPSMIRHPISDCKTPSCVGPSPGSICLADQLVHTAGQQSYHESRLSFRTLRSIAECANELQTVDEVFRNLKGFQQSLNTCSSLKSDSQKNQYVDIVLTIIYKVCKLFEEGSSKKILGEFLSERCEQFHMLLTEYVKKLPDIDDQRKIKQLCIVFEILLTRLPTSSWSVLPIDDLSDASKSMLLSGMLMEKIKNLKQQRNQIKELFKKQRLKASHKNNSLLGNEFEDWDDSLYRTIEILPSFDEICNSSPPILRPNIIRGSYKGWEHYYDVQFRLLREDFVAPLRRGIHSYLQGAKGRNHDISLYKKVQVCEPVFTRQGMCFKFSFDNSHFRKNFWEHSKRLMQGSLLCLSPDEFKSEILFGIVLQRKIEDLDNGFFIAKFDNHNDIFHHQSRKTCFLMAESRAYFEATRHILHSLQNAEVETMPFSDYLLHFGLYSEVKPPCYLVNTRLVYDMRWIYSAIRDKYSRGKRVNILVDSEWPQVSEVELDQSQLDAIKMALTQEVAVIQGPPGTGKTYIGYRIVQTLLQNRKVWDPHKASPILVLCLTNHALDQFLEGLLDCKLFDERNLREPKILRIGGGSKNERIQELNIAKKGRGHGDLLNKLMDINAKIDECAKHIVWKSLEKSFKYPVNEFIVGPDGMERLSRIINEAHLRQLKLLVEKEEKVIPYALEFWLDLWQKPITNEDPARPLSTQYSEANSTHIFEKELSELEELYVDIEGEGELENRERMLENDQSRMIIERSNKEENELIMQQSGKKNMPISDVRVILQGKQRKETEEVQKILREIQLEPPLSEKEEMKISDIRNLSLKKRKKLFRLWVCKYEQSLVERSEKKLKEYNELCVKATKIQQEIDHHSLEQAEVIGMTTTGAAKYQHIIHLVKPKIVIVEEAAELLESHIVSALNAGTQHLILIGDHKQLRPKPNEYDLAVKHNLHISLFERLIKNGLPHATLLIQHRMRPQIASLVCPHIYDNLQNHESVFDRDDVKGLDKNVFFFHHEHEEEEDENLLSHSNSYEAGMAKSLCHHLLNQGYSSSQITILTAYTGQLLKMKKLMPKEVFQDVKVVNVDNYQGEENDLVILSLVRSNSLNKVGFLRESNRVCVALSRARLGFYCFGNFKMLRSAVPIWEIILSYVQSQGCLGDRFPLHCHNHPETKSTVDQPSEFLQFAPEGGCKEQCSFRLECGHVCTRLCHPADPEHKQFQCLKPCERKCPEGHHTCLFLCHQKCNPCMVQVTRIIPKCDHEQEMFCHEDPKTYSCLKPCPIKCPEGHHCKLLCHQGCEPCEVKVVRTIPKCQHEQMMFCHEDPEAYNCQETCPKMCPEGHRCKLLCHQGCKPCKVKVVRTIPKCQHKQMMFCHEDKESFKCKLPCPKFCSEEVHRCPLSCGETCNPCAVEVTRTMPDCGHSQKMECHVPVAHHKCKFEVCRTIPKCGHVKTMPCSTDLSKYSCTSPCERSLECGHSCKNKCGYYCTFRCEEIVMLTLKCGHKKQVPCYTKKNYDNNSQFYYQNLCTFPCEKTLSCGHQCKSKCGDQCTLKCEEATEVELKCGHTKTMQCCMVQHRYHPDCTEPCGRTLPCGHLCPRKCGEKCPQKCLEMVSGECPKGHSFTRQCYQPAQPCAEKCAEILNCGHKCRKTCGETCEPCITKVPVKQKCGCGHTHPKLCGDKSSCFCNAKCTRQLKCGHICSGICGECYNDRVHRICKQTVSFTSFCGHHITMPCFGMQYECPENCQMSLCPHNEKLCDHRCLTRCTSRCNRDCPVSCSHVKCTKQCHQRCSVKACSEPCTKLLPCKHYCTGLCGEKCLVLCIICSPMKFKEKAIGLDEKTPPMDHLYIQLDCGHLFTVQYLDGWVYGQSGDDRLITPLLCPTCRRPMSSVKRYWPLAKQRVRDVQNVKKICNPDAEDYPIENEAVSFRIMLTGKEAKFREEIVNLDITSTEEGACLMNMLYFFNKLGNMKHVQLIKNFTVSFNHEMSEQLFIDLSSELYRLHLSKAVFKGERRTGERKMHEYLRDILGKMDANHNLRLSVGQYHMHLDRLEHLGLTDRMRIKLVKPLLTKGEWYKTPIGHIYFMPPAGSRK